MSKPAPIRIETAQAPDKPPFFRTGNEVIQIFLPVMGSDCFAVYSALRCQEFSNRELRHTIRGLARSTGMSASTVSRSLDILSALELLRIVHRGGCQESTCQLTDSAEVAAALGARYTRSSVSWSLPADATLRLQLQVKAIRARHQRQSANAPDSVCGNPTAGVSHRNAGVSDEARQRPAAETLAESYLYRKEVRKKEDLSPTPFQERGADENRTSAAEDNDKAKRKQAQDRLNGVLDDLKDHLLNTDRPTLSGLTEGYTDWTESGFRDWEAVSISQQNDCFLLSIAAPEPAAAQRGAEKYQKFLATQFEEWFGVKVQPAFCKKISSAESCGESACKGDRGCK